MLLALCVSTWSTGTSDTRTSASNTDKRITNENKWYKKVRKVSFVSSIIVSIVDE